jgi:hypothetical protein
VIQPDVGVITYGQEILIESINPNFGGEFSVEKPAQINFFYTLNKDEIPTPFSGTYYHPGAKLTLNKELLGAAVQVELKVIAVQEGTLPSEVAYRCYKVKEGAKLIKVEPNRLIIRPDALLESKRSIDSFDHHLFAPGIAKSGQNSVSSSPNLDDDGIGFNF